MTDLAFAGAGWVAAVHGFAALNLPDVVVARVASRRPERAAEAAAKLGATATTYEALPDGADGVVVCTPPGQHAEQVVAALEAGAGVLVEKPLCTTLADADRIVAAEARTGGVLAYAENLLHAPVVRLARAQVAELHDVDLVEVRALQGRPDWGDFLTEGWGGGALFDLGAHPIAIALLLAAPARPVEVRAVLRGADDHPVDEHAEVVARLDTGGQLRVVASWAHGDSPAWDAQVSCPDGVVRMELLPHLALERNGVEVRLPERADWVGPDVPALLHDLGYLGQLRAFADDLAAGRTPEVGAPLGRAVLDLTCAAYASAGADGAWVPLPFTGPRDQTPLQLWRG